jgi:hypothetical protein
VLKKVVIYDSVDGEKAFKKKWKHKAVPPYDKL